MQYDPIPDKRPLDIRPPHKGHKNRHVISSAVKEMNTVWQLNISQVKKGQSGAFCPRGVSSVAWVIGAQGGLQKSPKSREMPDAPLSPPFCRCQPPPFLLPLLIAARAIRSLRLSHEPLRGLLSGVPLSVHHNSTLK